MNKFNAKYFRNLVTTYVHEEGEIFGKIITSKQAFYETLSERIYVAPETIRSWGRTNSSGPGADTLERLAKCLNRNPEDFFYSDCSSNSNEKEILNKMNDFVRNKIYELNREMIYYFSEIDISSEAKFCELSLKIRALCLALPQEAALAIESYVAETLEPFIYDETSDLGIYCSKVLQAEKQWDEIAQRELKPLLFS